MQNLNPNVLERKFELVKERDWVKMLWKKCIPEELYRYICLSENYIIFNKLEISFKTANMLIRNFIKRILILMG